MEQRHITKRLIIDIKGRKNITDKTVLALRIPYKLNPDAISKAEQKTQISLETLYWKPKPGTKQEEEEKHMPISTSNSFSFKPWDTNPLYYEGYGLVYKVKFTARGLQVLVDINILSPQQVTQKLPESDANLYDGNRI